MDNDGERQVFDVIVVGAGVMGSAIAYETAKRGLKTALLEQFDFLHHRGSSHGESRTIRASYGKPYYCAMALRSSHLWEEAEAEAGYRVYFKTRHLDIGPSDCKLFPVAIDNYRENSIPVRVLDREEVSEEYSGCFQLPEGWIGVATPFGGVIKATKAVAMFQTLSVQNGAVLKDNVRVLDIKRDPATGEIVVSTSGGGGGGEFRSRKCVVAAGPWTRKLVKAARGIALPIQTLETTTYYWKIRAGHERKFTIDGGFPTFGSHGVPVVYGTPSMEYPGLIKVPLDGGGPCEPDERTWARTGSLDSLREWVEERFGGAVESGGPVMTQSCMTSMTPDKDFVVDFLGGEFGEDVVVAGGFSGHGFKMAPLVGRVAAEMVAGGAAEGVDLSHFRIGRFESRAK